MEIRQAEKVLLFTQENQAMLRWRRTSSASLVMGYFSRLEITSSTATMLWICNKEDKVTAHFMYRSQLSNVI